MKTIIITGPSGSGKSFLTNKLSKLFQDSVIIKTDSYYKDNKIIKFLSLFIYDIYDRPQSIKRGEIMKTIKSIYNKDRSIYSYEYDFIRKKSIKKKININYNYKNQFLIIEGVFAHRLRLNYQNTYNIVCVEDMKICLKRRIMRDQIERGRSVKEVKKRFNKSWSLFYRNIKQYTKSYEIISLNPSEKRSYEDLVTRLLNTKKN